jgi:hypothetical protein
VSVSDFLLRSAPTFSTQTVRILQVPFLVRPPDTRWATFVDQALTQRTSLSICGRPLTEQRVLLPGTTTDFETAADKAQACLATASASPSPL